MPTLIRLIVALLFLAGLVFGGLFALIVFVDPGQKEITVKIPARELGVTPVISKRLNLPEFDASPAPRTSGKTNGQDVQNLPPGQ